MPEALLTVFIVITQLIVIFGFVVLDRRQPAGTVAWILAVALIPVVGALLYVFFGARKMARFSSRHATVVERVDEALERAGVGHQTKVSEIHHEEPRTEVLVALGKHIGTTPATGGNHCKLLLNGPMTYRSMIEAIEQAQRFIHVQFYIIQPDRTGMALRDRLVARAKEGIEVRVLCDGVGSLSLPSQFWAPLLEAGGKAAIFSPVSVFHRIRNRDRINFRNHRKIVVVDGTVGFTGGINIGREYLGLNQTIGPWRDTHIRLEGPCVTALHRAFTEDWYWASDELLDAPLYFPDATVSSSGKSVVQIIDSGPDRAWSPIQRMYVQAISVAKKRVWVTSPYFIPDQVMEEALITAGLRGIDVRLLVPAEGDSAIVSWASKSYFPRLLEAGVRIFEYRRGFVHAKTLLVDDWMGTVGSANMDVRSFHLNFELNAFVFDAAICSELGEAFLADLESSREMSLAENAASGYWAKLLQACARLLSPLL